MPTQTGEHNSKAQPFPVSGPLRKIWTSWLKARLWWGKASRPSSQNCLEVSKGAVTFADLPEELLSYMLALLSPQDFVNVRLVCRRFCRIGSEVMPRQITITNNWSCIRNLERLLKMTEWMEKTYHVNWHPAAHPRRRLIRPSTGRQRDLIAQFPRFSSLALSGFTGGYDATNPLHHCLSLLNPKPETVELGSLVLHITYEDSQLVEVMATSRVGRLMSTTGDHFYLPSDAKMVLCSAGDYGHWNHFYTVDSFQWLTSLRLRNVDVPGMHVCIPILKNVHLRVLHLVDVCLFNDRGYPLECPFYAIFENLLIRKIFSPLTNLEVANLEVSFTRVSKAFWEGEINITNEEANSMLDMAGREGGQWLGRKLSHLKPSSPYTVRTRYLEENPQSINQSTLSRDYNFLASFKRQNTCRFFTRPIYLTETSMSDETPHGMTLGAIKPSPTGLWPLFLYVWKLKESTEQADLGMILSEEE